MIVTTNKIDKNHQRIQQAYQAMESLIKQITVPGYNGQASVELDIKAGTIVKIEKTQREKIFT